MLEVEPQQSTADAGESLPARNARLENKVMQLTREKKELIKKVAHYEEYTKRLCSVLRKLKGSIDSLAGQSALIGEALSHSYEAENNEQDEETAREQPQLQTKKTMQTASVLPMVRGYPIRRIIVPLQRLNLNSHRHRANRIHGHRREPWWRETEQPPQEPLEEAHRPNPRVTVRRLQRVERRQHRVVRPRTRPGPRSAHRRQEAAVVERAGGQNRRSGSSHQMLQAVVLLQRLSLTQHQQQQQRTQQPSQALASDNLRTPVVMLRDISTTVQVGDRTSQKTEHSMSAGVKAESEGGDGAGPSTRPEPEGIQQEVDDCEAPAEPDTEAEPPPQEADGSSTSAESEADMPQLEVESGGGVPVKQEAGGAEAAPCLEPCAALHSTECDGDAHKEEDVEMPASSQSASCSSEQSDQPSKAEDASSEDECLSTEAASSDVENNVTNTQKPTGDTPSPPDASVTESVSVVEQIASEEHGSQLEALSPEPQEGSSSHSDATGTSSSETEGEGGEEEKEEEERCRSRTPTLQNKGGSPAIASTPSTGRKRKASVSLESCDKYSKSPEYNGEREQSPLSETDQGCRPRRRCAIRKNYAHYFAGWNAD